MPPSWPVALGEPPAVFGAAPLAVVPLEPSGEVYDVVVVVVIVVVRVVSVSN